MSKNKEQSTEIQELKKAGFTSGVVYDFVRAPNPTNRKFVVTIEINLDGSISSRRLETLHNEDRIILGCYLDDSSYANSTSYYLSFSPLELSDIASKDSLEDVLDYLVRLEKHLEIFTPKLSVTIYDKATVPRLKPVHYLYISE